MIHTKIQTKKQKLLNTFSGIERLLSQLPAIITAYKDMQANDKSLWAPHASTS